MAWQGLVMADDGDGQKRDRERAKGEARRERLAAQLRGNLKKRREQQRARAAKPVVEPDAPKP